MMHRVRGPVASLVAAGLLIITAPAPLLAHDDPPLHHLETNLLYPAFANRPAPALELELTALLELSAERGYPIKVALVGSEDDLVDPEMFARPQAYAEYIVTELAMTRRLRAPIIVVSPSGIGVAGSQLVSGVLRPVDDPQDLIATVRVPTNASGDDLARTGLVVVRAVALAADRPLPDVVPIRAAYVPPPVAEEWPPVIIFLAVFLSGWLVYETWRFIGRRRGPAAGASPDHDAPA